MYYDTRFTSFIMHLNQKAFLSEMNDEEQIKRLEAEGSQLKANGFSYDPFAEACHVYWNLILEDDISFTPENLKFVAEKEVHEAVERQKTSDYERIYQLLSKRIRRNLTIEEMVAEENSGMAGFMHAFQGQGVLLGVYNHRDDVCYVVEQLPPRQIWDGHPNAFHALFSAHELSHRYVRLKRESLGIQGIGNSYWEEKYCRFMEAGFHAYVFTEGKKDIQWRRELQRSLGASLFDADANRIATKHFIAKYREVVNKRLFKM